MKFSSLCVRGNSFSRAKEDVSARSRELRMSSSAWTLRVAFVVPAKIDTGASIAAQRSRRIRSMQVRLSAAHVRAICLSLP